jgi:hypothetical protein
MKLKLPGFLCAMILLFISATQVKAQSPTQSNYFVPAFYPKAPNTAAFTKYGDYQVNLFTGVPDISIPLYTIDAGGLKIPITLSYHASGIRVSDVASWVGLGWSLSNGGTISRSIIGGADDGVGGYLMNNLRQTSSLNMTTNTDMDYVDHVVHGTIDKRPDIYSYDFPGHSGKFFFDGTNNLTPRLIPFAPISIKNTNLNPSHYTDPYAPKFALADEHGNNYFFGYTYTEQTTTVTPEHPGVPAITSWMLEKMISQNRRDTVSFSYTPQTVYYPDAVSQTVSVTDMVGGSAPDGFYAAKSVPGPTNTVSTYVSEQLIQQINFKNGKLVFELDPAIRQDLNYSNSSAYGLKDILVYAYNYRTRTMEVQKTIKFFKSNFNQGVTGSMRLRLDSIEILDKAGSIIQHYRFGYNTSITMPGYGSMAKDYWGFYNGKNNDSMIPQMSVTYQPTVGSQQTNIQIGSSVANSRFCDSTKMQACILDTIYYPTGGHAIFTYQTNQYLDGSHVLQQAGGLRVATISSYDGIATAIVKTYQYNISTARANFFIDNVFFSTSQTHRHYQTLGSSCPYGLYSTAQVRNYVANPRISLETFDAATVVYPNATEYTGTPSANTGYTDYLFRDQADILYRNTIENNYSMTGTPVITSAFYARGQLLRKREYLRNINGTYQLVKKDSSMYTAFAPTTYTGVGFVAGKIYANEGTAGEPAIHANDCAQPNDVSSFFYNNYDIISDDNYLTGSISQIYDINDPTKYTTSTVTNKYDNIIHQQATRSQHTDSKGNIHVSVNKFPADYPTGNALIDSMVYRNMQADVIEKWDSVKNVTTSVNSVSSGQFNKYKAGTILNTIVPSTISTLSVSSPVTNFTPSTVSSGTLTSDSRYVQMISFDQYDGQNNLKQYTTRNTTPVSVLWDYLYNNPIAQVKNASSTQVAYTSFEADGKGNWSWSGAPVTNPTAPTGSRVYPLNSGSITSPGTDNIHTYILSYWSNNGVATVYYASGYISGTAMGTVGGWTYYEHMIPVGNSYVTLTGTSSIDELRLYPTGAQMITYAYDPSGMTSIADTKGGINHFEYDPFQRLKNVKDWYGNIVNNYGYHTYDQTVGNDAIGATVFTRDNCPSGTAPQSTTYSVLANKYYSSTKASANAEAQYDLQTNGQAKADNPTICGCPIQTISFTLTNSSGYTGWQAAFTGGSNPTYNFPSSGSTIVQIPAGTYSSVYIGPIGSATHTFTLGSRTPITGAHSATFNTVVISSTSTDSSLTIQ